MPYHEKSQYRKKGVILSLLIFVIYTFPAPALANTFANNSAYTVCFTPGQNCETQIVAQLAQARRAVLVQAYSFTSAPILAALVAAKNRGVEVRVILDKSQYKKDQYSTARFLNNQGVAVWVDAKPAIAHNKVMVIDDEIVITGSFNFTKAAQYKNAENLLIISDSNLAKTYAQNWASREAVSWPFADYHPASRSYI